VVGSSTDSRFCFLPLSRSWISSPLRNVYAVSDKVLTMALSGILITGSKHYPAWLEVGVGMAAVDTLVHNYLHRT
jgi:hypothetical protein